MLLFDEYVAIKIAAIPFFVELVGTPHCVRWVVVFHGVGVGAVCKPFGFTHRMLAISCFTVLVGVHPSQSRVRNVASAQRSWERRQVKAALS